MAIQLQGNGGTVADVDGTTFRSLRTVSKPLEYGAFGHYRLSQTIPLLVSQAANGTLFSFRWSDATRVCIVQKLRLELQQTAPATASIFPVFQIFIVRSFSVSDSIGTALTLTTNSFKKRTTMGSTLVGDIRFATVAAGLTAGTRTLDGNPILELNAPQFVSPDPTTRSKALDADVADGNHPYVLATNEGLIVRGPTVAFGTAGTANLIVDMAWTEAAAY